MQPSDLDLRAHGAVVLVLRQGQRHVETAGLGELLQLVEVEVDRLARGAVAAHPVLHVPAVAGEPRRHDLGAVQQQGDLAVAEAVRGQQLELVGELERELVAADDGVDGLRAHEVGRAEHRRRLGDEGGAKGGDVLAPQAQAAGGAMPAEGEQVLGAALDGAEQIEGRDAAPGALGLVVALAEQDGRTVEALDDARRDDADDALVPVRRREHERRRRRVGDHLGGGREDAGLDGLTLAVELVEAQRQRQRRVAVGAAQQLERQRRVLETAGGVEPRRQTEADGAGVDAARLDAGDLHERRQPGPRRAAQPPEADAGQHAVLADQRHDVGDGADGDHVGERRAGPAAPRRSASAGSSSRACASLKATPTPARCGHG